jgi:threonine aldolase
VELSGEFATSDKLDPKSVDALLGFHNGPKGQHVQYLTGVMLQNPTSTGHVYSPEEIKALSDVAHKHGVPLVMEMAGASYFLAKTDGTYRQYTTDCGVDAVTLGLQGIGGSPASAIMVLNDRYLRWKKSELQLVLDRTVKENGGRQSTALTHGWEVMLEKDYWRVNAGIANANVVKLLEALQRNYEFDGKPMEFQNLDPANNVVAVKLPQRFMDCMNKRGYELWSDSDGYVKIRAPYHVTPKELDVFYRHFQQSYEEYQELEKSKSVYPRSAVARSAAKRVVTIIDREFGSDHT